MVSLPSLLPCPHPHPPTTLNPSEWLLVIHATYLFNPRSFHVVSVGHTGSVQDQKLVCSLITDMAAILNRKTDPNLSAQQNVGVMPPNYTDCRNHMNFVISPDLMSPS